MRVKKVLILMSLAFCFWSEFVLANQVKIVGSKGSWQLMVDGKPFYIKGVGLARKVSSADIDYYLHEIKKMGLNSFRTWGIGEETSILLDGALKHGLMVDLGIWLLQNKKGEPRAVDYVNGQEYKTKTLEEIANNINKFKGHPALLMWNVGNEVVMSLETEEEKIAFAKYVEDICQLIHKLDPNHPTVYATAWSIAWPYFKEYAPSMDIYGVNIYGGLVAIHDEWERLKIDKPYLITEYGPHGEWEAQKDANGQPLIPSESQKAKAYVNGWKNHILKNRGSNLGAYIFAFEGNEDFCGSWFNIFMVGQKRASYWKIYEMFTGKKPENSSPVVYTFELDKYSNIYPEEEIIIKIKAKDPDGDKLRYVFKVCERKNWGEELYPVRFIAKSKNEFVVTAPNYPGMYFLYLYVTDGSGNIAVEAKTIKVIEKK